MTKLYATKMINTGGRAGEVHSPDKSLAFNIAAPGRRVAGATNPEQLFAAGYASCFNGALELAKEKLGITGASTVSATVSLFAEEGDNFYLAVEISGQIAGVALDQAQKAMDLAHTICPYSKATAGNIDVKVIAVA